MSHPAMHMHMHHRTESPQPGRHRGPRGGAGADVASDSPHGRHRAEVQHHHGRRALAATTLAAGLVTAPALAAPASAESYTVRSGDTLSSIAQANGTTWRELYDANRDVVSSPTTIHPGQTLRTGGGTGQAAPASDGAGGAPSSGTSGQQLLAEAEKLAGTPYVYGGDSPSGFDCSGFTSHVFAQVGKSIPRTSSAQAAEAAPISERDLRPGDLIFYSPGGSVSHVAIYAGDGMVWEAPGTGGEVQRAPIWDVARSYGRF